MCHISGSHNRHVSYGTRVSLLRVRDALAMAKQFVAWRMCWAKVLDQLIRTLEFICKVCRPGRAFLRRFLDTLKSAKASPHRLAIAADVRKEVQWWCAFLPT